jgi:hypothetical protein
VSDIAPKTPKAAEKYFKVFGRFDSLAKPISWATGISNMLEWLVWDTSNVLGITKTEYLRRLIAWSAEDAVQNGTVEEKINYVSARLARELQRTEQSERYAPRIPGTVTAREALRRAKYLSEEYLNKEFDIFWILVSDDYLDQFYRQFTPIEGGGPWSTHGNSGLFHYSTGITEMQMDNLSYNESEALLVANELKHGGRKNPDQILKYALMFKLLRDRKFIAPQSRFLLLFIGAMKEKIPWRELIQQEINFCKNSSKSTARDVCHSDVIAVAESAEYESTTWSELMQFNENYWKNLDPQTQQVERKLLSGFNESVEAKKFMQNKAKP